MKEFFKRIWNWIKKVAKKVWQWLKQVFSKVVIIEKEDWELFVKMNKENLDEIWGSMDADKDGKVTPKDIGDWFKGNK